jgi:hypothetical protein
LIAFRASHILYEIAEKRGVIARSPDKNRGDVAISKGDCFASLAKTGRTFSALSFRV